LSKPICFAKLEISDETLSNLLQAFTEPRTSAVGHSLGFQKMASGPVVRDQSAVGQAASTAAALHNPLSLMQDLKSTTDSRISRPS